jgi:hypothetical protein
VAAHQALHIVGVEHRAAGEEPVGHAPQGVDVGAFVARVTPGRLGRHEGRCPEDAAPCPNQPVLGRGSALGLHQSEVRQLHEVMVLVPRDEMHVLGLDVAVHQAVRVHLAERGTHLVQDVDGALRGDGPEPCDQLREVQTLEQLHHDVERAAVGHAEIEQADGVG